MRRSPWLRRLAALCVVLLVGVVTGVVLDMLIWRHGWPYPVINWLAPLLGAEGEAAHDAMRIELILQATLLMLVAAIAIDQKFDGPLAIRPR